MIFAVDALKGRRSGGNNCSGPLQRRHGDRPRTPTYMSRRLRWINVFAERPALILNLVIICGDLCPSSAVQMSSSPPKNENINLSVYPSLLPPLVLVFQAIIFPGSSLIWFQSLSVSSETGEPKRNPDSFEATIVCLLKAV